MTAITGVLGLGSDPLGSRLPCLVSTVGSGSCLGTSGNASKILRSKVGLKMLHIVPACESLKLDGVGDGERYEEGIGLARGGWCLAVRSLRSDDEREWSVSCVRSFDSSGDGLEWVMWGASGELTVRRRG